MLSSPIPPDPDDALPDAPLVPRPALAELPSLSEILATGAPTLRTRRKRDTARSLGVFDGDRDILDQYLHEVSRTPLLTQAQEIAVARRVQLGDEEAMQELVKRNLRFVISVAKKYQNRGLALTDLIGEGNIGLMTAARKFDPDQGVKFISYAVWWIRQSILAAHDDLTVVVEHVGWPHTADDEEYALWKTGIDAHAARPNTYCKLSGLAMPLATMDVEAFRPWISYALEAFGADRCMFASNFPVDSTHGTFDDLYTTFDTLTADCTDAERAMLFATNAEHVYRC